MAKFTISFTVFVEETRVYNNIEITKKAIIEELGLEGEDKEYWDQHVADYIDNIGPDSFVEEHLSGKTYEVPESYESQVDLNDVDSQGL